MIPDSPNRPGQPKRQIGPANSPFFDFFATEYESELGILWVALRADAPHSFTPELLEALRTGQSHLKAWLDDSACDSGEVIRYQVLCSSIPGVFSRGGDLRLFRHMIMTQDKDTLLEYAYRCVDVVYTNATNYERDVMTISLVQGDALGGGFEAALAANIVIAERGCQMGLPEVLFNLFPGMGAYQLLSRRMSRHAAEQFIGEGRVLLAEGLFELGLVDVLAEPGEGREVTRCFIRRKNGRRNGLTGIRNAIQQTEKPLQYDHLRRFAELWAECAMSLQQKDIEVINYLISMSSTA